MRALRGMRRGGVLLAMTVAGGFLAGCGGGGGVAQDDPARLRPTEIDRIFVGDRVTIELNDIPEVKTYQLQVKEDGTITLGLLDQRLPVSGKTVAQVEQEIRGLYVPKFFTRMTVTVRPEQRFFYVSGAVRRRDRYVWSGNIVLTEAISIAGGFTEFAKESKVEVTRSDGQRLVVDCKRARKDPKFDVLVYPGDSVFVPQKKSPFG